MPDSCGDAVNCEQMRNAISQPRELSALEAEHLHGCDSCLALWLDTTVANALETKPKVRIPADFAARVAARLPDKRSRGTSPYRGHWGLISASLLAVIGLAALAIIDPVGMNTRMGSVFVGLIALEIAAMCLWLGIARLGEHRS